MSIRRLAISLFFPTLVLAAERVEIPLMIDGEDEGLISTLIEEKEEDIKIPTVDLFRILTDMATQELQLAVWEAGKDGQLSLKELWSLGIEAHFDQQNLQLNLSIPPTSRKPKRFSLSQNERNLLDLARPAKASFFLNSYASRSFLHQDLSSDGTDNSLRADFDAAVNIGGVVLEGEGEYSEFDPYQWRRGQFRLVYDQPQKLLRYSAGDLLYPASGFRSYVPLGGLSVARDFSLDPELITQPSTRTEVQLKHPSRVDVIVNGALIRTLNLPAGRFDVRDIPVGSRVNQIELVITDIFGRVETLQFPFIAASELLKEGLHQFSYDAGFPSTINGSHFDYDTDLMTLSAYHRVGITDHLTGGAFYQGNHTQTTGGLEAITVNSLGLMRAEGAFSFSDLYKDSYAARFAYRSFTDDEKKAGLFGWGLQAEFRDRRFSQLGNRTPDNRFPWTSDLFFEVSLTKRLRSTIGGFHQWARAGDTAASGAYINTVYALTNNTQISTDLSYTDDAAVEREVRALITLRIRDADRPIVTAVSHDTRGSIERVEAVYDGERARADANLSDSRDLRSANVNLSSFTRRAQLGYALNATDIKTTDIPSRTTSLLQFGTAFVWADGSFGIGRPVADSFAIVGSGGVDWQKGLRVNPANTLAANEIDFFGPAVLSDITAYRYHDVLADPGALTTGYSLKQEHFIIHPRYKSGYWIPLNLDTVIVARGRLVNADGTPAGLVSGAVVDLGKNPQPSTEPSDQTRDQTVPSSPEFFTDRDGRFELSSLNPGRFEMRFYDRHLKPIPIEVKEGVTGFIELQTLTVVKEE